MAADVTLRALIVDDEPLAIDLLQLVCAPLPCVEIVGTATDGDAALRLIEKLTPDLVLLDIAMPGLDGVAVARILEAKACPPAIIFCTAYRDYALAAFEVAAIDYLLKPVDPERLERALMRARTRMDRPAIRAGFPWLEEIWAPYRSEMIRIGIEEIDRIEAQRDYIRLHVGKQSFLLHQTLSGLERRLDPARFIRLHRSTIVRRGAVLGLRHDGLGAWVAKLPAGEEVRIARPYVAGAKAMVETR
jgi:two-component system response regulator AlgR